MQIPQIRMESKMARIEIIQQHGEVELHQPKADLSISQPKADVSIQTSKGKLTIDQTQAWEDMNLMSVLRFTEKNANKGRQAIDGGTVRRARQGNELMRIENDSDPISSQAITNGGKQYKLIGLKYIPSVFSVKLDYEPGTTTINSIANSPIIDATVRSPQLSFNRGGVHVNMAQHNELHIDFVNVGSEQRG